MRLFTEIGETVIFFKIIINQLFRKKVSRLVVLEQIWKVTTQSLLTTSSAGFLVGAIMTIQFTMQMKEFGALGYLGGLATSGTIREIGPLLIAFMLAGKIGAFTSAELGTMKATEQIDAIRCLGANPIQEIIVPRFLAIIISSFFLFIFGLFLSIIGGILLGYFFAGVSPEEYLRFIPRMVTFPSILLGLLKCFIFSTIIATVCTYRGYSVEGGAKAVGQSVVVTAVFTMISIVLADWLTSFFADVVFRIVMEI